MADGRGVGHTLLAPGVAARGVGVDRLAGHYQIVNATNQPFVFHAAEYVAVPASRKQAVSGTTTVINPAYAEPGFDEQLNPASAFEAHQGSGRRDAGLHQEPRVRGPT